MNLSTNRAQARRCVCLRTVHLFLFLLVSATSLGAAPGEVEIIRDRWGIAHVFAEREPDGFFGLGWACAEDRLVQMDLFRRRGLGRLAEVFGEPFVASDRKFRLAGIPRYCAEACANLPAEMQGFLQAYAAGVNAYVRAHPEGAQRVAEWTGVPFAPWTPADCLAAWMGFSELFDRFMDEGVLQAYRDFQQLVAEVGEAEAVRRRTFVIDDAAAIVPESEMAKDKEVYARLKAMQPTPGFRLRGADADPIRFSHAWAVGGARSTTGKPILESDPQTSVNFPAIWYEFHLAAGRYDTRGIGVAGCPALLVGWNRHVAWGVTALGSQCAVTYLERLSPDGKGWLHNGRVEPFERRLERIDRKSTTPLVQEVLTNRHGFVFNALARNSRPGEAYVSHYKQAQDRGCSVRAMLLWMRARDWADFLAAMEHYYTPGLHLVFADARGNLAYQTLAHIPRAARTTRLALEGWTAAHDALGRVPLAEMPHMLNPDTHVVSHANNLPVGSWYPHDLGIGTGGTGDTARSMRLRQLLAGDRRFSVEDFERVIHRDTVDPVIAAFLPVARKIADEERTTDPAILRILEATKDWRGRFEAADPAYPAVKALAGGVLLNFRMSGLRDVVGGGEGGLCHLARLLEQRLARDGATPKDPLVRDYLLNWLRAAGGGPATRGGPRRPSAPWLAGPEIHAMPYQENGPLRFPSSDRTQSPPLTCGQVSTIWSQQGNSYTQIVDLADIDNSRSLLPPGISERRDSPFHWNQTPLWVEGATHAAPLARAKVEALAASSATLTVQPYQGPPSSGEKLARSEREGAFAPALPKPDPARGGRAAGTRR